MTATPKRGFSTDEYAQRTQAAQRQMAEQGLAGILLTTETEIRYFSGFHTLFWQSPTRPWFIFVPATGKPIAIIPEIGEDLMRKTWLDDIRTWPAPTPADDGITLLIDVLTEHTSAAKTIGLLKGHETHMRMPLGDFERLCGQLPGVTFTDATPIIRSLRMVKSDAEIAKLRHICAIGSKTFDALPTIAREGIALDQLFREFRREALAQGADDVPYLVGGADQDGYSDVISPPSDRKLSNGDVLMLDTGATWDGYFCDFDRNWSIGPATDSTRRAYDTLWQATEAGIDAARPGATCRDVFDAITKQIRSAGDVGRMGHGLGMQLTEWPSLAVWDDTPLRENMVITIEPSMTLANGKIMVHEENIVIREGGTDLLTKRATPEIPII
jgi:Xaa-Pro aminopeptidase